MKSAFLLFCKIGVALATMWGVTSANAYTSTDESYVKVNLGPSWKLKQELKYPKSGNIKQIDYINASSPTPEFFGFTIDRRDTNLHFTSAHAKELIKGCQTEDVQNISLNSEAKSEWGFLWQCQQYQQNGFIFYFDGDPNPIYSLQYNSKGYPLTSTERAHMIKILKSIEICYKNKSCTPLVQ